MRVDYLYSFRETEIVIKAGYLMIVFDDSTKISFDSFP